MCTLTVADDGPGLPADFDRSGRIKLGQGILHSLAGQLHGRISFSDGPGAVAKLTFPE
jgi:two-component sensor histidine kinase